MTKAVSDDSRADQLVLRGFAGIADIIRPELKKFLHSNSVHLIHAKTIVGSVVEGRWHAW